MNNNDRDLNERNKGDHNHVAQYHSHEDRLNHFVPP